MIFPFLGGILSGVLIGICSPPFEQRILPWFALLPFFLSLDRHRARPWLRALHGISLGVVVALIDAVGPVRTLAGAPASPWIWAPMWAAAFALLAGTVLRASTVPVVVLGLSSLWTGLEFATDILRDWGLPGGTDGLHLATCLVGGSPEATVARLAGAYGVAWLLATTSGLFLSVFRETRTGRQVLLATLAIAAVVACRAAGRSGPDPPAAGRSLSTIVVARMGGGANDLVTISTKLHIDSVDLLVWPRTPLGGLRVSRGEIAAAPGGLLEFLRKSEAVLIASAEPSDARDPSAGDLVAIAPDGKVLASGARSRFAVDRIPVRGQSVGVGIGESLGSPAALLEAVRGGAGAIVVSSSTRDAGAPAADIRQARWQQLRAVELGRWIVRGAPLGATVVDTRGAIRLAVVTGLEGAGLASVPVLDSSTPYVRGGWILGPACGALALVVLVAAARERGRRRSMADG